MQQQRFSEAKSSIARAMTQLGDLYGTSDDMRLDGLPQNWIDDIVNLDADQIMDLKGMIKKNAPKWALALRALL